MIYFTGLPPFQVRKQLPYGFKKDISCVGNPFKVGSWLLIFWHRLLLISPDPGLNHVNKKLENSNQIFRFLKTVFLNKKFGRILSNDSGAIVERSRACVCLEFVVRDLGSNPAWGCFFVWIRKNRFSGVGCWTKLKCKKLLLWVTLVCQG